MTISPTPNPPAFPISTIDGFAMEGMSLRDWFAGQALAGLLASEHATMEWIAKHSISSAFSIADAMLAERAKP